MKELRSFEQLEMKSSEGSIIYGSRAKLSPQLGQVRVTSRPPEAGLLGRKITKQACQVLRLLLNNEALFAHHQKWDTIHPSGSGMSLKHVKNEKSLFSIFYIVT